MTRRAAAPDLTRLSSQLHYHDTMLRDGVRNAVIQEALNECVFEGARVLDVGAGVGTWSIAAARLGASRVVAVEIEELLIPYIYRHAVENGVSDRIEIVHGDIAATPLRGKFDLIVAEVFTHDAMSARTFEMFQHLRSKYLARGGVLIPEGLTMMAAPARSAAPAPGLSISTESLAASLRNYPQLLNPAQRDSLELMGPARPIAQIDFRTGTQPPNLSNMEATLAIGPTGGPVSGVVTYNVNRVTEAISLDTFRSPSWGVTFYPVAPVEWEAGTDLTFRLSTGARTSWSVSDERAPRPRTGYGPDIGAATWQLANARAPRRTVRVTAAVRAPVDDA
jgi:SAM-dependent methyltransferase